MNILIISDFSEKIGGAEIYNYQLKKLLEDRGHRVDMAGGKKPNKYFDRLFEEGIKSYFSPYWKKKIKNKIEKLKPDILFVRKTGQKISPYFLPVAKRKNIHTIMKPTSLYQIAIRPSWGLSTFLWPKKIFHNWYLKDYVDIFIAPSKFMARTLKKSLGVSKVKTIRNPLPWKVTKEPNISNHGGKLLYAGRLSQEKGLKYLIKSIAILSGDIENISLEIAGEGSSFENLCKISKKLGIKNKIDFLGRIPHKKLKEKYYEADVFCLPSITTENSPLTIPEAMSQGTPVITTNIGGQAELVKNGETGFLVNPKDSDDLAEKLETLLKKEKIRKKMSENSLEFAKRFSPEKHVDNVLKIFYRILS